MDIVYFIVLVGVLIFVHEWGHFFWAKFFGVKVLKFSLGFGPRIWGFTRGDTEYVLAAIPLGGYVRMMGENPLEEVASGERHRAFNNQVVWKRVLIVVAGPAMNLLLPLFLYFVVFLGTSSLPPAIVGTVLPDHPAEGSLRAGDQVLAIEGKEVATFYDLTRIVADSPDQPLRFELQRGEETVEEVVTPVRVQARGPLGITDEIGRIGITYSQPLAVVGVERAGGPADQAGLKTFDRVVSAGGQRTDRWTDLEDLLNANRGTTLPLTVLRPRPVDGALGGLLQMHVFEPRLVAITPDAGREEGAARAGLEPAALYISVVEADSPEAEAGLMVGDRLVSLNGTPVRYWPSFLKALEKARGELQRLEIERAGERLSIRYRLRREQGVTEYGERYDRYSVGLRHWSPSRPAADIANPGRISFALSEAWRATADTLKVTAYSILRLLQGQLTMKSIGGPLTIFDAAGDAGREGAQNFLFLMGFISVNLGLINLLPIPLLDGGHLVFLLVEWIGRRPISLRVREYASIAGLALLILLMMFAFKNDIERKWPSLMQAVSGSE